MGGLVGGITNMIGGGLNFMGNLIIQQQASLMSDDDENNKNYELERQVKDADFYHNPLVKGFIKLNNQLESFVRDQVKMSNAEIQIKTNILEILDLFLNFR